MWIYNIHPSVRGDHEVEDTRSINEFSCSNVRGEQFPSGSPVITSERPSSVDIVWKVGGVVIAGVAAKSCVDACRRPAVNW